MLRSMNILIGINMFVSINMFIGINILIGINTFVKINIEKRCNQKKILRNENPFSFCWWISYSFSTNNLGEMNDEARRLLTSKAFITVFESKILKIMDQIIINYDHSCFW